jgi:hypothetical protein
MERDESVRYLIYQAWISVVHGEPIPVDTYIDIVELGYSPEKLTIAFLNGLTPPIEEANMIIFEEIYTEEMNY